MQSTNKESVMSSVPDVRTIEASLMIMCLVFFFEHIEAKNIASR